MAGRPRQFDADDVLDAAVELFWRRGFEGTSTRDVATETGLTASSLYNAFGSKQALLDHAMERYERRITDALLGPLERSDEGMAALEAFVRGLGRWIAGDGKRGCMLINLMAEDGGSTPEVARRTHAYRERLRTAFQRALRRAEQADETEAGHAAARADLLVALVLGINVAARGGATAAELRRLVAGMRAQIRGWMVP